MILSIYLLSALALLSSTAAYSTRPGLFRHRPHIPYIDTDESVSVIQFSSNKQLSSHKTTYYFDQLIDHTHPDRGTFKQRYWHSEEFYQPGGPVILCTPGETDASGFSGYLTNASINGMIAQQLNGTTVVLEHRFFGESNPAKDLSVDSLQLHTIQQALDDFEYFAKNVVLPMDGGDQLKPDQAAWILIGGSYSGALTGFALQTKPDVWWAGYASSAVVEARGDLWDYAVPIQEYMPKNCSNDMQAVIAYIDTELESNDTARIYAVKQNFGMGSIEHSDDFAAALVYPLYAWQDGSITVRSDSFYQLCDAMEVKANGQQASARGWGVDYAFAAMGRYWNETYYKTLCGDSPASACFNTWDPKAPGLNNVRIPSDDRSWKWMQCNEFGFWDTGAPKGRGSLISRALTTAHAQRDCQNDFPEAFSGLRADSFLNALGVNRRYGGWDNKAARLIFANGERDPWREATVAAARAPPSWSDAWQPHLISDGFHCSDMDAVQGASPSVRQVQLRALEYMVKWFEDWRPKGKQA